MKIFYILFFAAAIFSQPCGSAKQAPVSTTPVIQNAEVVQAISTDTLDFVSQIQPVLQKNCSPCHFPGGKMYKPMPFDKPETILTHQPGTLKRLKGDEKVLVERFFAEHSSVGSK